MFTLSGQVEVLWVKNMRSFPSFFWDHYHRVDPWSWFGDWRQNILLNKIIEGLLQMLTKSYWYSPWGVLNRINFSIQTDVVLSFKTAHPFTIDIRYLLMSLSLVNGPLELPVYTSEPSVLGLFIMSLSR